MAPPFPGIRFCLALALASALPARAPEPFAPRLAQMESILDRFYRGESLAAAQQRLNAEVDASNAQVRKRNAEVEAARAEADRASAASRQQDAALGPAPDPADGAAVRAYNQRVDARNAAVRSYNAALAASNARIGRLDEALDQARARLEAEQRALKARQDAYEAWCAGDRDVAFFTALNRLLADLRSACRSQPSPALEAELAQVRNERLELARWAAAREAAQDNGLVLVEARVDDEPCCFIVDSGAQLVCLPGELIDALGLAGKLGEDAALTLAGGQKLHGRAIVFDRIAAAGGSAAQVAGAAVPASEVGIDGLLGQSFLKRFACTLDAGRLALAPRKDLPAR